MITIKLKNNSGVALILVIGILTVLLMIGLTVIQTMRVEEKTADSYFTKLGSLYFAKSGFDHGVCELKLDITLDPNKTKIDAINIPAAQQALLSVADNRWQTAFAVSDATFIANNPNLVYEIEPGKYARWFYVKRGSDGKMHLDDYNWNNIAQYPNDEIVGRYAILVTDESSKVNINTAGDLYTPTSGPNVPPKGVADPYGHSDFELRLTETLREAGVNNTQARTLATSIVQARYGAGNDTSNTYNPGSPGDDDNNSQELENDGLDNDGDGYIDSSDTNEGTDDPMEFFPDVPYKDSNSRTFADQPFNSIYDLLMVHSFYDVSSLNPSAPASAQILFDSVLPFLTANSKTYNQFYQPSTTKWLNKISLNSLNNAFRLYQAIRESDYLTYTTDAQWNRLLNTCANVVDYYDYDLVPTKIVAQKKAGHFFGTESIRINEVAKLSGHVIKGNTGAGVGWGAPLSGEPDQWQATTPGAGATITYTTSVPHAGRYIIYAHSGKNSTDFDITYEKGTGNEVTDTMPTTIGPNFSGRWRGSEVVVNDGTLNIEVKDNSLATEMNTAIIDFFVIISRYVEFVNMANRPIPLLGAAFSFDGGTTKYYITKDVSIPAATYDENGAAPKFGYLVIATNIYSFEKVWEAVADHDGDLDEYLDNCNTNPTSGGTVILTNTSFETTSGTKIQNHEDWGLSPGTVSPLTRIISPALYLKLRSTVSDYTKIAWDYQADNTAEHKVGWLSVPDLPSDPPMYNEYNRERVSLVSDDSPWVLSDGTTFSNAKNTSFQLGTPGIENDNAATQAFKTTGGEGRLLWQCKSHPIAGNFEDLTYVTTGNEQHAPLLYQGAWEIDLTPVLCVDTCRYQAFSMDSPPWANSPATVGPFFTPMKRGTASAVFEWGNYFVNQPSVVLPGKYSLFVAGNYSLRPYIMVNGISGCEYNPSNIYSRETNDPSDASFVVSDTRECSVTIQSDPTKSPVTPVDFGYVMLSPKPYEYGKININTAENEALYALKIGNNSEYCLSDADILKIRDQRAYFSIGELVNALDAAGNSDKRIRQKWSTVSRYITVRSDVFQITAIGQSIRDKTPGDDFNPAVDKLGATDRIIGIVDRSDYRQDSSNGKIKVLNYRSE